MKKKYIPPIIEYEEIDNEDCGILTASNGWAIHNDSSSDFVINPVYKESDNPDDWGEGNDDDGWGGFIDID